MAKRTKKSDPQQKNKQNIDYSHMETEFANDVGSTIANQLHKEKAKQARKSKNTQL